MYTYLVFEFDTIKVISIIDILSYKKKIGYIHGYLSKNIKCSFQWLIHTINCQDL